jgi:nicotinate-nucleotide pyrophosphorylase
VTTTTQSQSVDIPNNSMKHVSIIADMSGIVSSASCPNASVVCTSIGGKTISYGPDSEVAQGDTIVVVVANSTGSMLTSELVTLTIIEGMSGPPQ